MVQIEHLIGVGLALVASVIGVYVKVSNDLALAKLRIQHLEKQAAQFDARINTHDDKIQAVLLDLKTDISELKVMMEQRFNGNAPRIHKPTRK
jgi:cysteine synthase